MREIAHTNNGGSGIAQNIQVVALEYYLITKS